MLSADTIIFFYVLFLDVTPISIYLLYHDISIITMISWFFSSLYYIYLFLFWLLLWSIFLFFWYMIKAFFACDQDIFAFCSRIVNIIAEIFIPHRVFVYKSWTIYKIQNIQNTKFFASYKIQNTKFIFYIDKIFFLEHFNSPLNKGYYSFFVNKC